MAKFVRPTRASAGRAIRETGAYLSHYWRGEGLALIFYAAVHFVVQSSGATTTEEAIGALRDAVITALVIGGLYAVGVFSKKLLWPVPAETGNAASNEAHNRKQMVALANLKITSLPGEVSILELLARRGDIFIEEKSFAAVRLACQGVFFRANFEESGTYETQTREFLKIIGREGLIENRAASGTTFYKYTDKGAKFNRYIYPRRQQLQDEGLIIPTNMRFPTSGWIRRLMPAPHLEQVQEIVWDEWASQENQERRNQAQELNP